MTLLGAGLLWVGWFGFNAGSSVSSGMQTGQALAVTQIAAAMGALTWMILEGVIHKKATSLGLVSGILAGIVGALGLTAFLRTVPDHGVMKQFLYQSEGVLVSIVYSAIVTLIIAVVVDKTLGLKMSDDEQRAGMDHDLHREHGYGLLNLN